MQNHNEIKHRLKIGRIPSGGEIVLGETSLNVASFLLARLFARLRHLSLLIDQIHATSDNTIDDCCPTTYRKQSITAAGNRVSSTGTVYALSPYSSSQTSIVLERLIKRRDKEISVKTITPIYNSSWNIRSRGPRLETSDIQVVDGHEHEGSERRLLAAKGWIENMQGAKEARRLSTIGPEWVPAGGRSSRRWRIEVFPITPINLDY